jgi:hypothetical protein
VRAAESFLPPSESDMRPESCAVFDVNSLRFTNIYPFLGDAVRLSAGPKPSPRPTPMSMRLHPAAVSAVVNCLFRYRSIYRIPCRVRMYACIGTFVLEHIAPFAEVSRSVWRRWRLSSGGNFALCTGAFCSRRRCPR